MYYYWGHRISDLIHILHPEAWLLILAMICLQRGTSAELSVGCCSALRSWQFPESVAVDMTSWFHGHGLIPATPSL